jgi:hypothetical protein
VEQLRRQADPVLQVENHPSVARESVQPVGAQPVRSIRLHLDFAIELVPVGDESAADHGLRRGLGRTPHRQELAFDERVLERAGPGPRRRAERRDQEPSRNSQPLRPGRPGAHRGLGVQDRRRVSDLERQLTADVEVFVPEEEPDVVLDRELGPRELDAGEDVAEAALVRQDEAVGTSLHSAETSLLPPISDEEARDRTVSLEREAAARGHFVGARVHAEPRDLAAVRVQPGLAASLIEEKRAAARRIERAESARQREVSPVPVAVGVVQEVEPQTLPEELRVGVENLAGRTVRPLRHRERDLLAQAEEVLLFDRHAVVGLPAGAPQVARELCRPGVPGPNHEVDLVLRSRDRLRSDRHRPEDPQSSQVPLGLRDLRGIEHVPLREEELAPDDLRPGGAMNSVGDPTEEVRLGVLEDVFALDADAPDPRPRLRSGGGRKVHPHENAQEESARRQELRATRAGTRIVPGDAA